jgi:membrane-associated protein
MLDSLVGLVSESEWTYALILAVAALDAIFPIVPSETTAIAAGVAAATGELSIGLVVAAAAAGAFAGDASTYGVGRLFEERAARRVRPGRMDWARRTLSRHGSTLIVVARFVPGGRTATMLTAGLTRMPPARFLPLAAIAAALWASYASLLGYLGGRAFENEPWRALVLAFVLAFGLVVAIELVRRARRR